MDNVNSVLEELRVRNRERKAENMQDRSTIEKESKNV